MPRFGDVDWATAYFGFDIGQLSLADRLAGIAVGVMRIESA
jgi:hypothetical protein